MFISGVERFGSDSRVRKEQSLDESHNDKFLLKQNDSRGKYKDFYNTTNQRMVVSESKIK